MKIFVGADHGGFELKKKVLKWMEEDKYDFEDLGAENFEKEDDFVDYALDVAEQIVSEENAMGILLCRNGFGMSIAANRVPGVRCGVGFSKEAVFKGRNDDDINCVAIPADYLSEGEVKEIVDVFLKTKFSGEERYKRRLYKLEMLTASEGCCGGGGCGGDCCGHH